MDRAAPSRCFPAWTETSLREALERDDVEALSALPGIGKKTAQKIILTLKGKLTPAAEGARRSAEDDIATALVGMGFDRRTAKDAVMTAMKALGGSQMKGEELERELFKRAVAGNCRWGRRRERPTPEPRLQPGQTMVKSSR